MEPTLREILTKWNGGIYRGSQRELAKRLGINEATVSSYILGKGRPGEKIKKRIGEILKLTDHQLERFFPLMVGADNLERWEALQNRGLVKMPTTTTMENSERLTIDLPLVLADKFDDLCKREHRDESRQMVVILEDWFAQRERQTVDDNTIVHPSTVSVKPGVQPFAHRKHSRRLADRE